MNNELPRIVEVCVNVVHSARIKGARPKMK